MYALSKSSESTPLARWPPVPRHSDEMRSNDASLRGWFELRKGISKILGHFPHSNVFATWNIACSVFRDEGCIELAGAVES